MNHNKYMKIALTLAEKARGYTSPNPMVGSIIVKNGTIVSKGYHKMAGGNHAEVETINQAGTQALGATLYVTLEPCNHTGKTPPCTKKIIKAGISHVVFATKDPNPNVAGNGGIFLEQHGIKVTSGICEKEATILNEHFIKHAKTGYPFVIAKCASTLDGRIATRTGDSKWITGHKARQYAHKLRHSVDAIMVGKNTIHSDDPSLTTRLCALDGSDPARIVLDTNLSISQNAKVITQKSDAQTYIITGKDIDKTKEKLFEKLGIVIISLTEKNKRIRMREIIKLLGKMNFNSLLVEGGGEIMNSVLSSGLTDKICFFYAPKILTGSDGIPMCSGSGPDMMQDSIAIRNILVHRFGKDIMLEGYCTKN